MDGDRMTPKRFEFFKYNTNIKGEAAVYTFIIIL